MNSQPNMLNPFDGALFIAGTAAWSLFAAVSGGSPLIAAVAGAFVTGMFLCLAKVIELFIKAQTDKRVHRLQERLDRANSDHMKALEKMAEMASQLAPKE